MAFKKFNEQEKRAYKSGKIAAYYRCKARERRNNACCPVATPPRQIKYSDHVAEDAFMRALERTYGSNSK